MAKPRKVVAQKPRGTLCHQVLDLNWDIQLLQEGPNDFTVVYGSSVRDGLTYNEAALEYGAVIMHALACRGLLNSNTKEEES